MTTDTITDTSGLRTSDRRDGWRGEIAELLDFDPGALADGARLVEDLGLDSLAMMSLFGWLDAKGVTAVSRDGLHRVGDILALLEKLPPAGMSVVVANHDPALFGPSAVPTLPRPAGHRSPLAPVLANHIYRLTPIEQGDLDFLYTLATHPETGYRWRYRGTPPPPTEFAAELWGHVLVQFVARRIATGEPAGLVVAYNADLAHGHAYLGAVFTPEHAGTGHPAEITILFVRYLFHTFRLRKLYLDVPGFNWPQLCSAAGRLFQVEGVLRDHDYYAGRYWDKYLCAIYPPADETRDL